MQKLDVLNYPIYSFQSDLSLVEEILADVKTKTFYPVSTDTSQMFMSSDYYQEKLFSFFDQCVNQVKKIYYKETISFPITDCWVNKYNMMHILKPHTHSNSYISGLFYLTTHVKSGATCFSIPDPWSDTGSENVYRNLTVCDKEHYIKADVYPTAGTLLLFPSKIGHHTKTLNTPDQVRYTISFNCFPAGNILSVKTGQLDLQVLSVKDRINSKK